MHASHDGVVRARLCAGKTTAVAMFAAALLICVPSVELMIFSVSLNSSRKMLEMIKDFIEAHPVGCHLIVRPTSKDKLTLKTSEIDRRTCESRPGRGQVAVVLFLCASVSDLCLSCVYR